MLKLKQNITHSFNNVLGLYLIYRPSLGFAYIKGLFNMKGPFFHKVPARLTSTHISSNGPATAAAAAAAYVAAPANVAAPETSEATASQEITITTVVETVVTVAEQVISSEVVTVVTNVIIRTAWYQPIYMKNLKQNIK